MTNVIPFNFENKTIRVIDIDGAPWFVAADVCSALGLSNTTMALRALDEDEVTLSQIEGSHRPTNLISESGLYALTLRSDKAEAKPFRRWITKDVIPTIRKTGGYQSQANVVVLTDAKAREARLWAKEGAKFASLFGFEGNQLAFSVNNLVHAMTGVNMMGAMQIEHAPAPVQEQTITPMTIGAELGGLSAQRVNMMLITHGFQTSARDHKGRIYYEPTEKGKENGGLMVDTQKKDHAGTPVRQLRWGTQIVEALRAAEGGDA